jgi:hypothetical protein
MLVGTVPLVRTKLLVGVDAVTGAARVVTVAKMAPAFQPAFDATTSVTGASLASGSAGRTLSQLTSATVTQLRQGLSVPLSIAHAPRELNNDAVIVGRSLERLLNPALPVALVNDTPDEE